MDININPNLEMNTPDAPIASMKIVSNKTHQGPVKGGVQKSNRLSAAANKIRLNNDLKVTLDSVEGSKKTSTTKTSESEPVFDPSKDVSASRALIIMEAWDKLYSDPGTPDYVKKANALSRAQLTAYATLGINPTAGVRPELTEEQRSSYNDMVSPYAFDYYEVRLSYKQPGQKSVRSTTYRYLERPNLRQIRSLLLKQAKVINAKLKVSAAPRN
jgi:hypothetical protein